MSKGLVVLATIICSSGNDSAQCIDGYKFAVGWRGNLTQVLDESGNGIKCKNKHNEE